MKKYIVMFLLTFMSISSYSQSYNDLFTVYKSVQATPRGSVQVPQYQVMDPSKFAPQKQVQSNQQLTSVTGVYIRNGQYYSIKMKVAVSDFGDIVVKAYYNNHRWWNCDRLSHSIGYGVPEQIRDACEYEVYLSGVGTVYF